MYTASIVQRDSGKYVYRVYDSRTGRIVYTGKETSDYGKAKEYALEFLHSGPNRKRSK